jgi:endonuclease/exonuclease/phosphatase family metal-dependent hydrolase
MRLVSYNILNGGEGRADPLAETLLAQKPDIVALIEADNQTVVQRIADRLGMEFIHTAGKRHGLALLSRWPIIQSINHTLLRPEFSDGLLEATVRQGPDQDWTLGVLHLHPRATIEADRRRQTEIAAVCEIFQDLRHAQRPHLLAGDFNADSPVQEIDPNQCKPSTRKAWEENGRRLPRGAVERLLAAGYVDTLHALRPETARRAGSFTTQYPGQRVDYVFSFGFNGRLKSAWIEQDRLAKYASDHFPVGLEVD